MSCPSMGPIIEYQLFLTGPIRFGRVQIILVTFKLDFFGLSIIIWTVQNHFGPIEGQGINHPDIGNMAKPWWGIWDRRNC